MIKFGLTCGIKIRSNNYNASYLSSKLKSELKRQFGEKYHNVEGNIVSVNGINYYIHGSDKDSNPTFTLESKFLIKGKKMNNFKVLMFRSNGNGGYKYCIIDKDDLKLTAKETTKDNFSYEPEIDYESDEFENGVKNCYLTFLSDNEYISTFGPRYRDSADKACFFSVTVFNRFTDTPVSLEMLAKMLGSKDQSKP